MNLRFALIVALGLCVGFSAFAQDKESIYNLRNALIALSPRNVDPHEAELLSTTAHVTSRQCARDYGAVGDPAFHNYLINIGLKKKGICADYTRDRRDEAGFLRLSRARHAMQGPSAARRD